MRVHGLDIAVVLAALAAGCGQETVLRIDVQAGAGAAPAALRVTLTGAVSTAPRLIMPVTLPGTVVAHGLPAVDGPVCVLVEGLDGQQLPIAAATATVVVRGLPATAVCVQAEGLDGAGNVVVGGATTVQLAAAHTTAADVQMANGAVHCAAPAGDMGQPADLGGVLPDGAVALCPAGALFCDDFESGTFANWTQYGVKYGDMGSIAPSMTRAAHGAWSAEARASGQSGMANYAEVEKDFTPRVAPPVAVRANVWSGQPLTGYTIALSVFDDNANGLSLGADGSGRWVVTEDQATVADHTSTVATTAGWHCLELVVDGGGMVSAYVDGALVIGPFARNSTLPYGAFVFGIDRTVQSGTDLFVDDVAIAPARLYCP